ncbi:hypothetical protein K144313037_p20060 (plasmid) [Clostridium tetani]|uniref:hypothetical protein n=1 Tax=Clostridium tetani TaxID=1513 RepID=UPI002955649D|nr:hypothetical protein [Clostridium tetani]BDR66732.1 hypothetical protein K144312032_09600 [Clostridium tetani]BDR71219.1 hypothetical protein K144313037_p20060 [Clostridium tetani]BDR72223.1 hypothetical protein K144316041_09310 [Clostridium tetani]BEV19100.1 hypothetical protein K154301001_09550 [Clostridium tetani]
MATFKNPVVTCDKCNKDFKLKQSRLKTEIVAEGIERTYFKCPKCKHKFIVMYKDKEIEENLKEMDSMKVQVQKLINEKKDTKKLMERYEELYYRNLDISEIYKSLYGR